MSLQLHKLECSPLERTYQALSELSLYLTKKFLMSNVPAYFEGLSIDAALTQASLTWKYFTMLKELP